MRTGTADTLASLEDPKMDALVEYYRRRVSRYEMDADVAEMQIALYAQRQSAIRPPRTLTDIPRPKPIKHSGRMQVMTDLPLAAGEKS